MRTDSTCLASNRSRSLGMWIGFAVWTALCGAGCQETSNHGTSDLGTSTDLATTRADLYQPPDLSHPPAVSMTIRDINDGKVSAGTWVVVEGVVTAPSVLGSAIMLNQQCLYELVIGQPAAAPTLHDGIALRLSEVVATGDMMVTPADCQSRAAGSILGKVSRGDAVTVTAQFVVFGSLRYLNLAGGQLTSQGPAATKPQPVLVTTSQLVSATLGGVTPAVFFDANGALVRFVSVTTTQRNNLNQSWKIAASGSETRLGPAYLRVANAAFAPPADGTVYSSVTGIVAIDLAGTVTPRDASDLVP